MNKTLVSEEIKGIKRKFNLTNQEFAERIGSSMHTVQAWCTDRRQPSKAMWKLIESEFNQKPTVEDRGDSMHLHKILELQEEIIAQQKEIMSLRDSLAQKVTNRLPSWESVDYDIATYQTYDLENSGYVYFTEYDMIRWQDFFERLGYFGKEAEVVWDNVRKARFFKYMKRKDFKPIKIISDDKYGRMLMDTHKTYDIFMDLKKQGRNIQTMQSYDINYLHKNGSRVPAIVYVLFDVHTDSSHSKIKFLNTNHERN